MCSFGLWNVAIYHSLPTISRGWCVVFGPRQQAVFVQPLVGSVYCRAREHEARTQPCTGCFAHQQKHLVKVMVPASGDVCVYVRNFVCMWVCVCVFL